MIYKFFIGRFSIINCDKVIYETSVLKDKTLIKWLVLYVNGTEIGRISLRKNIKITYEKEYSTNTKKEYFVD